jgi:hypothetical protein
MVAGLFDFKKLTQKESPKALNVARRKLSLGRAGVCLVR